MLITFITSQRKSIPAIRSAIEKLCILAGNKNYGLRNDIHLPTIETLSELALKDLESCGLGYRAPYIYKTTQIIRKGEINLEELYAYNDEKLIETLKIFPGVGIKVANCVALLHTEEQIVRR